MDSSPQGGYPFLIYVIMTKRCWKCKQIKSKNKFYSQTSCCKQCSMIRSTERYEKYSEQILQRRRQEVIKAKKKIIKMLGGKCRKCGISDYQVLEFNHIDASKKGKVSGAYSRIKDWNKNIKINNLELLCANCHRKYTWKQRNWYTDY